MITAMFNNHAKLAYSWIQHPFIPINTINVYLNLYQIIGYQQIIGYIWISLDIYIYIFIYTTNISTFIVFNSPIPWSKVRRGAPCWLRAWLQVAPTVHCGPWAPNCDATPKLTGGAPMVGIPWWGQGTMGWWWDHGTIGFIRWVNGGLMVDPWVNGTW